MTETELETIVVRITGDGSPLAREIKMLTERLGELEKTTKQTQEAVDSSFKAMQAAAQQLVGVFGALGIASSLNSAFHAFEDQEKTLIRLQTTLRAYGKDVDGTIARYTALAEHIGETTLVSKQEAMHMLQKATMMGLTVEKTEQAVRISVALAGVTGQSAEGMLRAAAAMERGNYQLAQRMILGRGVKLSEEELASIMKNMVSGGMEAQNEMAKTAGGRLEILGRSLKFVSIEIGGMVATALNPLLQILQSVVNKFKELDPATRSLLVAVAGATLGYGYFSKALTILRPMLGPLTVGIKGLWAAMLGPWGLVIAAVAIVVMSLGGFGATWTKVKELAVAAWATIKDKAAAFWTWFQPIWMALRDLGSAVWLVISEAAGVALLTIKMSMMGLKEVIYAVWEAMIGRTGLRWGELAEIVKLALLKCEFAVNNFEKVWGVLAGGIAVRIAELMGNAPMVRDLQRDLDRLNRPLLNDWNRFRDQRQREWADELAAIRRNRAEDDQNHEEHLEGQLKKEKDKLDTVLRWSAQALATLTSYRETFQKKANDTEDFVEQPVNGAGMGRRRQQRRPAFRQNADDRPFGVDREAAADVAAWQDAHAEADRVFNQIQVDVIADRDARQRRIAANEGMAGRERVVDELQREAILEDIRARQLLDAVRALQFQGAGLR